VRIVFVRMIAILLVVTVSRGDSLSADDVVDYLLEDICLTPGVVDPTSPNCASRKNVGGIAQYYRHDYGFYQAKHAYPRKTYTGGDVAITPFDFRYGSDNSLIGSHEKNYDATLKNKSRDGGDFIEHDGAYTSIFGTSDPGLASQTFYGSTSSSDGCGVFGSDGWLLFMASNISNVNNGGSPYMLFNHQSDMSSSASSCAMTQGAYVQTNYWLGEYTFLSGQTLLCITVEHYAGNPPGR
jgi:hypothetical protein